MSMLKCGKLLQYTARNIVCLRNISDKTRITVTDDGSTIACWHPEQSFPYEHTKPFPKIQDNSNSVFKLEYQLQAENIFKSEGPNTEELQMLTFTPKHKWTERKSKRVVPIPPHPRDGI